MKRSKKEKPSKRDRNKEKKLRAANRILPKLIEELKIAPTDWDYLLVSDGSGTELSKPCGWCGVLIHRSAAYSRWFFHGNMNTGTNIMAEMMGIIHPLMWLSRQKKRTKPARIHVITDCEVVKNAGNKKASRKSNRALWYFLGALERELGSVEFHWMPRESTTLNRFADRVAGISRLLIKDTIEREAIKAIGITGVNINDLNPS